MTGNRGLANQALFHARILLDAWELVEAQGRRSARDLAGAFCPAVVTHLLQAYGWFLLAVTQADTQADPTALPRAVADLPAPPAGKSLAPEVREFELRERDGWLGDLLQAAGTRIETAAGGAALLASDRQGPGRPELRRWADELSDTMLRMDDSLSEC